MDVSRTARDGMALPLIELRSVGPERSAQLARLGVRTVGDLLLLRPRRHEDRRKMVRVADLRLNEPATVRGQIVALGLKTFSKKRKSVFEIIVDDGTARLHCRWWNLPYMQNYFAQGDEVLVFGKPLSLKPRTIDHPETEVIEGGLESSIHINRIAPVYPLTEGLPQRWLRSLVWRTLEEYAPQIAEPWPPNLAPDLMPRRQAVQSLHFPEAEADAAEARRRLALDELVELQLALQARRRNLLANARGCPCIGDNRLVKPFLRQLAFQLTQAQTKVLREFRADLASGIPMRRLLQGDVGSGKTVVAACCSLICIESGRSVALMAPTEILAEQHFQVFTRWFTPLGIPVQLRTGAHKPSPEELAVERNVNPSIVIGTHALIEDGFAPDNLGLVVIDEQHRFGVAQREKLVRKGAYPHLLVMTATPIPRTLGLTLYGDLDISVIEELPSGRAPLRTFVRPASSLPRVWAFVRKELADGRQAFVVLPRVEDTSQALKAVTTEFEVIQQELAPFKVGLLHGRLSSAEKEMAMTAFRQNALQVLLSTSLIEVGIDVPNATVMLIEDAEQFGLAQLHQLRGRIGRGAHESYCILIARGKTRESKQRLDILAETTDGFRIAEADLKLRGPGDLLGLEQSGLPPFRFADLVEDLPLIQRARDLAARLLSQAKP
ncbi:MAG: ATP-dependent DNA helicase RecG [Verrucomicrobiia bacterium]